MSTLSTLTFDNRFTRDLPGDPVKANQRRKVREAYSRVTPTTVAAPKLVAYSKEMAETLGIQQVDEEHWASVFGGNQLIDGMDPFAMCYGGHQFGNWAGQLGDGRAINLGEVLTANHERWVLQLKGAGPTPFSRTADGLAVLRSSVREFLCSEAMFHLGVPTTRALTLVTTGEMVERDMFYDGNPQLEQGAVVCRVAPSFVRFGNFELPTSRRNFKLLKQLVDHTIRTSYPELLSQPTKGSDSDEEDVSMDVYAAWFAEVCRRTAEMIVHWMRVGFVHGVMNTDNMSILGLTIDYGPYGWLEDYDPNWTPNTTDAAGRRYRFGHQPQIAAWNLSRLATALIPLVSPSADDAVENEPDENWIAALQAGMDLYGKTFREGWDSMMCAKLGLQEHQGEPDTNLIDGLTRVLQLTETDMTIFFRNLADLSIEPKAEQDWLAIVKPAYYAESVDDDTLSATNQWISTYRQRLKDNGIHDDDRKIAMNRTNPKYVLRNYMAQLAIDQAENQQDYQLIHELLELLRRPYDDQPDKDKFAAKRPEWARHRAGCSMLSCSS